MWKLKFGVMPMISSWWDLFSSTTIIDIWDFKYNNVHYSIHCNSKILETIWNLIIGEWLKYDVMQMMGY